MTTAIIIPARLASTRLSRKLLLSATGKPLIQHTYEAAAGCKNISLVAVATADEEIADAVRGFGGTVIPTSDAHENGTSRIVEAAASLPDDIRLIVNVQGDEPALEAEALDKLIDQMQNAPGRWDVGTLVAPLHPDLWASYSTVKAAVSGRRALYFSRAPLAAAWHHVGVYAYRRHILSALNSMPSTDLMLAERLEQLYFLEVGWNVLAVRIARPFISVDTPDDYEHFVRWFRERHGRNGDADVHSPRN